MATVCTAPLCRTVLTIPSGDSLLSKRPSADDLESDSDPGLDTDFFEVRPLCCSPSRREAHSIGLGRCILLGES